jgi:predicted PurR-regulated permease PerM
MLRSLPSGYLVKVAAADAIVFSSRVITILAYMLSSVFLALYIMIDRDRLRGGLFLMVPRSYHLLLSRIMLKLETIVGGYMLGQLITSVFMSLFVFSLLKACGISNALAIAVFAGLADILPYIGAMLAVAAAVAAATAYGPVIIAIVLAMMLCYKVLENQVIVPAVYGRALRLPSSVILFSLLSGTVLLGIPGALLALPVAAVVVMLIEELRVDLPGQQQQPEDVETKVRDDQGKAEYERRAEGMPAEQAAAIAVEISSDRREDEKKHPLKTDAHEETKGT